MISDVDAVNKHHVMGPIPVANGFEIITTLLSDRLLCPSNAPSVPDSLEPSQFYMLDYHRDRMLAAVQAFGWPEACETQILNLKEYLQAHLEENASSYNGPLRVRFLRHGTH